MDNSTTFHSEYEKKSDVSVAPFMLSVPGFVKALFLRKYTDAGPLVLETVIADARYLSLGIYTATCSNDLILYKIDTTASYNGVVRLPDPSSCPGGVFIIKDDLGVAGTPNPHNPGNNYKIRISNSGSGLFDGLTFLDIENQKGTAWVMSDGTNYKILEVL